MWLVLRDCVVWVGVVVLVVMIASGRLCGECLRVWVILVLVGAVLGGFGGAVAICWLRFLFVG